MAYTQSIRKLKRTIRRWLKRHRWGFITAIAVIMTIALYLASHQSTMIPSTAYVPLLNTIADGESNGSYNAHFGNAGNTAVPFTSMTLDEVRAWQIRFVEQGNPSNAVGRYQIIQPTLEGLIAQLELPGDTVFNQHTQDTLAIALLERRGAVAYINNEIPAEQFAHNLSQEWAALPRVTGERPEESYYAGDGLNASHVSSSEILSSIQEFKIKAQQ